ncbi:uncharacterized protein LOC135944183 [Cloeon dipterum]|uniref:uncharacterized protein LOC135944183 n=1 Tax=Cloeon dipterum TaxID=197152 RepID=UPI00321FD270
MKHSEITVIDQLENAHRVEKVAGIVNDNFFYLKVCKKMSGEKYSFQESKFYDLSADTPNAELLYYDYSSTGGVLNKFADVTVMSKDNCSASFNQSISDTDVCIYNLESTFPEFCLSFSDEFVGYINRNPFIAINGQMHGFLSIYSCDSQSFVSDSDWTFTNIAHFRSNIIAELPEVDNV